MTDRLSILTKLEIPHDADLQLLSPEKYFFNEKNLHYYHDSIEHGLRLISSVMEEVDQPCTGINPNDLAREFQGLNLDEPLNDLSTVLNELKTLYLKDAIYFHHPHYVAHLNCPVVIPAILAELMLVSINSSVDTWDQSIGATLIEQKLIDWTVEKIGFGPQADGIFTSGGTQSNLMAMLLARDRLCNQQSVHQIKHCGLPKDFKNLRILVSDRAHFSIQKSAAVLGLGYDAVIPVKGDRFYRMDVDALHEVIMRNREQGNHIMAVVATAGTTDFGSIDPLAEIAVLCRQYDIWLHVDAAYGCGLLLSKRFRHWLLGIEEADSVTVDFHKSFFQPVSCGAFLARDSRHLSSLTYHAEYLNPLSQLKDGTPNLVNKSLQTTRRFDALKLWLTLRTMGAEGIGHAFEAVMKLARQAYLFLLSEPDIEILHQPQLSTLVFRYRPMRGLTVEELDRLNAEIRKRLYRSGKAVIAGTKVNERQYLKFTLLNPVTSITDIQAIVALIRQHGQQCCTDSEQIFSKEVVHG